MTTPWWFVEVSACTHAAIGYVAHKREAQALREKLLAAYRWQYIVSGAQNERFMQILGGMLNDGQMKRVVTALTPLIEDALAA